MKKLLKKGIKKYIKEFENKQGITLDYWIDKYKIADFHSYCLDMNDIIYDIDFSPTKIFSEDENLGGILPYFKSSNEKYSYLKMKGNYVIETAEKKVISDNASAGTYFFRNLDIYLKAVADSIEYHESYSYNNILFLCPSFNGVIKNNMKVIGLKVENVDEISLKFHKKCVY